MKQVDITDEGWISASGYKKNVLLTEMDLQSKGARVQVVHIAAGETVADHFHESSFEVYYVLEGQCTLFANGERVLLQPGSLLLMEPGDVHSLHNHGSEPFLVLVFKTNAEEGDTFWR